MPVLRPVVPLELSPETEPFFLTGRANLMIPSSYSGGVPLAPMPVYGGGTATGSYGGGSPGAVYGGNTARGVELPPIGSGSAPGGGVTVNTGFGPH